MMKVFANLPKVLCIGKFPLWLTVWTLGAALFLSPAHGRTNETVLREAGPYALEQSLEVARQDPASRTSPPRLSFEPIDGPVSEGFTQQVIWVRFTLLRDGVQSPRQWWLASSNVLLSDTRLFETSPTGADPGPEIEAVPEQRRRIFQIDLPDEKPRTFLMRISSETALSTTLTVWQQGPLMRNLATEALFWGCIYAFFVISIAFNLGFWMVSRAPPFGVYTCYVTLNSLAAVFTDAWPLQIWPALDHNAMVTLLGLWISLAPLVGALFSSALLELDQRSPKLRAALVLGSACISAVGGSMVVLGHYRSVMPFVQGATIVVILLFLSVAITEATRARRAAWFFLGAFSPFYVGVIWRYLRNLGLLEPSFWNDHSYQIGAVVHMLVMSVGLFLRFTSERRAQQLAAARLESQRRLGEEQRELIAMMSHEFRTPLTIASMAVENLLSEASLAPETQRRLQRIVRAHERLLDLMEGYLTNERLLLSSISPQVQRFDLDALCRGVLEEIEESQGAAVTSRIPGGLNVMGDPALIRIAVRNLLKNARRHSPEGSAVLLSVEPDHLGTSIRVFDRGEGVPPSEQTAIFERFYRGKSALAHHGFGLGLHLVKSIAENHGGTVSVNSPEGGGCEFVLWIPRAP